MKLALETLDAVRAPERVGIDSIIDARAPSEFATDHVPGAINLPVLDDAERARVGTLYVQHSRFEARRVGAALVARNVAAMLDGPLAEMPRSWRPVVYCWRGGQRSGALAVILQQVGWPVRVIDGGYRAYRRVVARMLYDAPFPAPLWVLDGDTGTGKTALLGLLAARGVQVLDLEAMARHRGSLFGRMAGGQPTQKAFESALALAISGLDPTRPVLVEAESHRIGRIMVPPALWTAMRTAPRLRIEAPLDARAALLARDYAQILVDPGQLVGRIEALRPWHSRARIEEWQGLARTGAAQALARALLAEHYDPRYRRSRAAQPEVPVQVLPVERLDAPALEAAAGEIERRMAEIGRIID